MSHSVNLMRIKYWDFLSNGTKQLKSRQNRKYMRPISSVEPQNCGKQLSQIQASGNLQVTHYFSP